MKNISLISIILILSVFSLKAQENNQTKYATISITVYGVCGMCEERIENALDVKGVKSAEWDRETHVCTLTYIPEKISEDQIHQLLNEAGHDTEKSKASDEQYARVHECCKYREHEDH